MSFTRDLRDLMGAIQHKVYSPSEGYDALQDLVGQRRERRAAQSGMADELSQLAYEGAKEGDPLATLLANPEFSSGLSTLRPRFRGQVADSLSNLFTPQGSPKLPGVLPATEAAGLGRVVIDRMNKGASLAAIKQEIHTKAQSAFKPAEYEAYFPEIEKLINDIYEGPSEGYTIPNP